MLVRYPITASILGGTTPYVQPVVGELHASLSKLLISTLQEVLTLCVMLVTSSPTKDNGMLALLQFK